MPHVIVKIWPAKSDRQKQDLAEDVTRAIMATGYAADAVSVAIEEVQPNDRTSKVYKPDILDKPDTIYKKPGYSPL